jgi:hypothetical protein
MHRHDRHHPYYHPIATVATIATVITITPIATVVTITPIATAAIITIAIACQVACLHNLHIDMDTFACMQTHA